MEKFKCKIINPKGKELTISATIYKGKVARVVRKGIGKSEEKVAWSGGDADVFTVYEKYEDVLVPILCKPLAEKNKVSSKQADDFMKKGEDVFKKQEFLDSMFVIGENPGGYYVYDIDEKLNKKRQQDQIDIDSGNKPIHINSSIFGFRIFERLSYETFSKIKKYASYHTADEEEMEFIDDQYPWVSKDEVKGWHFKKEAIYKLVELGIVVKYNNEKVSKENTIKDIQEKSKALQKQVQKEQENIMKQKEVFEKKIQELNIQTPTKEEIKLIQGLPQKHLESFTWDGPDIYGGGRWFHIHENDLFIVYNNGMDGDDWSVNNYKTGGAGAIARKATGQAKIFYEINKWINSLGDKKHLLVPSYNFGP